MLTSFAKGQWHTATEGFKPCHHAITGQLVAQISSSGLDFSGMLDCAKSVGQPALAKNFINCQQPLAPPNWIHGLISMVVSVHCLFTLAKVAGKCPTIIFY